MPVCALRSAETRESVVSDHASGIKTNCDVYVYSFSREELRARMTRLIDAYNEALEFVEAGCTVEECTGNDELDRIKWTDTLKQSLRRRQEIVFDESRIREVLYRPFTKLWLYEDDRILSSAKTISAMFPKPQPDVDNTHTHTHTRSHQQPIQQDSGLSYRHRAGSRSQHARRRMPSDPPVEAILINLTLQLPFGVLATDRLVDLCVTGRQTRCLPAVTK
ncbi:MAG: hypothetical protein OXC59_00755 [Acidimicrobiaceae bacterium]|nr:hypothetical protein [Acidimicrobiaceae bacterium]